MYDVKLMYLRCTITLVISQGFCPTFDFCDGSIPLEVQHSALWRAQKALERAQKVLDDPEYSAINALKSVQAAVERAKGSVQGAMRQFEDQLEVVKSFTKDDEDVKDARKALEEARSQESLSERKLKEAEDMQESARKQVAEAQKSFSNAKNGCTKLKNKENGVTLRLSCAQKNRENILSKLNKADQELERARTGFDDAQDLLDEALKKSTEIDPEAGSTTQREVREASGKAQRAQSAMEKAERDYNSAKQALVVAEAKCKQAEEALSKAKEELSAAETVRNNAEEELSAAETVRNNAKEELDNAQEELDNARKNTKHAQTALHGTLVGATRLETFEQGCNLALATSALDQACLVYNIAAINHAARKPSNPMGACNVIVRQNHPEDASDAPITPGSKTTVDNKCPTVASGAGAGSTAHPQPRPPAASVAALAAPATAALTAATPAPAAPRRAYDALRTAAAPAAPRRAYDALRTAAARLTGAAAPTPRPPAATTSLPQRRTPNHCADPIITTCSFGALVGTIGFGVWRFAGNNAKPQHHQQEKPDHTQDQVIDHPQHEQNVNTNPPGIDQSHSNATTPAPNTTATTTPPATTTTTPPTPPTLASLLTPLAPALGGVMLGDLVFAAAVKLSLINAENTHAMHAFKALGGVVGSMTIGHLAVLPALGYTAFMMVVMSDRDLTMLTVLACLLVH